VEAIPEVAQLSASIIETRAKMHQYAAKTRGAETTSLYKQYQQQIDADQETLNKLRKELLDAMRTEAVAQAEAQHKARIQALTDAIERLELSTRFLQEKYGEQLKELEQSGGDSLDLEWYRTELAREEKVFTLISDRTIALKTELDAPGRVKLIDSAHLPTGPVENAPWRNLLMVTLVGFCVPFGLAILWERTAKRVADASTLRNSDIHVVAEVAALPVRSRDQSAFASQRSKRELSLFEESIDSLRTGLRLSRQLRDLQVLAVSSAVSREGKTSLASQLSVSMARSSGERTLLIDADMRAPNIWQVFDVSNETGLANVLSGECRLEEAIDTEYSELLHVLPAGELKTSPHRLVGDDSLSKILSKLRKQYRYIVIDTPPVLSAGESLVLSAAADATLLCAMRNRSRTEQVREAYNRLEAADGNPIGVVLNGVPVRRYSYSYGRYGYGYHRYSYPHE
jgi:capsular exopolysaccharide synthesis family protein